MTSEQRQRQRITELFNENLRLKEEIVALKDRLSKTELELSLEVAARESKEKAAVEGVI